MTLHGAIEKLLIQSGRQMTTSEIAMELNKNKWYQKRDGSIITPFQIHGRTTKYPHIFSRNGSSVYLIGLSKINLNTHLQQTKQERFKLDDTPTDTMRLENTLMDVNNFKSAAIIDNLVPDEPGLYCIRIKDTERLPKPFDNIIKERNHNIIYIGIASKSLSRRFLNQEIRANGHGTFFRSIGAVLGYRPLKGSLLNKANNRNYTFKQGDVGCIIEWINENLIINWVAFRGDFESVETRMIQKHLPLLNLAKNPMALQILLYLRAECVMIANS